MTAAVGFPTLRLVRAAIGPITRAGLSPGRFRIVDPAELEKEDREDMIGMWGVDMAATEEYGYQRAGCQYFVQEASKRGIKVALPPESDLLRPMPMYGVSEWSHAHIKSLARKRELEARLQNARNASTNANNEVMFLTGALDDLNYMTQTWMLNDNSALVGPDEKGRQMLYLDHAR